jgi:7-cyano-7-deazaguanine synthase
METRRKAVVLLSGGLDSATVLAIAKNQGYDIFALSFNYGQRHDIELRCAEKIAKQFGAEKHIIIDIDLRKFGGSALTADIDVPKNRSGEASNGAIPITYVPARNTIFLSFALAWAEVIGSADIFIGVNSVDYSGYPDCRPEFIDAYQAMANTAIKAAVEGDMRIKIHTPLMNMSKAEIILCGTKLGVNYSDTITCYDPAVDGRSCGECDACILRKKGFQNAGIPDPTQYI